VGDLDKELDATAEEARNILAATERFRDEANRMSQVLKQWKIDNGLDDTVAERFFNSLSPEDKKKAREEQEAFERQTSLDIEEALQMAKLKAPAGSAKKLRIRKFA
jgi:hypothetical protein